MLELQKTATLASCEVVGAGMGMGMGMGMG